MHKLAFEWEPAPRATSATTLAAARAFIEGPLETWRSAAHDELTALNRGLSVPVGDHQEKLRGELWRARMSRFILLEYRKAQLSAVPPGAKGEEWEGVHLEVFKRNRTEIEWMALQSRNCAGSAHAEVQVREECRGFVRDYSEFERPYRERYLAGRYQPWVKSSFRLKETTHLDGCRLSGSLQTPGSVISHPNSGTILGVAYRVHVERVTVPEGTGQVIAHMSWPLRGVVAFSGNRVFQMRRKVDYPGSFAYAAQGAIVLADQAQGERARVTQMVMGSDADHQHVPYSTDVSCKDIELAQGGILFEDGPPGSRRMYTSTEIYDAPTGQRLGWVGGYQSWVNVLGTQGEFSQVRSSNLHSPDFTGWVRNSAIGELVSRGPQVSPREVAPTHVSRTRTSVVIDRRSATGLELERGVPVVVEEEANMMSRVAVPGMFAWNKSHFWVASSALQASRED